MHGLHWLMENGVEVFVDKKQRAGGGVLMTAQWNASTFL